MTSLRWRTTRAAWRWCLVYTTLVPELHRDRRRAELLSHLWESERAALPGRALARATIRGSLDDVTWAVARAAVNLGPAMRGPSPYLAAGASLPVIAWVVSMFASSGGSDRVQLGALVGSLALLAVAGLAWWGRHRRPG